MALDLGPCRVYWGTAGSEVDLGKTQGGVKVTFTEDVVDLKSDQFGTQPEDQAVTGHGCTIMVPLAEYSLDNLAIALGKTKLSIGAAEGIKGSVVVGTLKSAGAKSMLLKKYVNGVISTDENNWMQFPLAAPEGNIEINFDGENQRIIETTFRAFPYGADDVLYYIGDDNAAENGS